MINYENYWKFVKNNPFSTFRREILINLNYTSLWRKKLSNYFFQIINIAKQAAPSWLASSWQRQIAPFLNK